MKIAILHHDVESPEGYFAKLFREYSCDVDFFDIRAVCWEELISYDLVFNRVYSSVAPRDFESLEKTIEILKKLENVGTLCVNSSSASLVDYSKYELYKALSNNDIFTPETILIDSKKDFLTSVDKAIGLFGFPIVAKRNCGGKSYEVYRVNSREKLIKKLKDMFSVADKEGYKSGFILQEFIKANRSHDCRIGVVDGKFLFAYSRTFVSRDSNDKWIASTSNGSIENNFEPTREEIELAIKAKEVTNVMYGESDVIMTDKGPCLIEINPSPGYFLDSLDDLERMKMIVDSLVKKIKQPIISIVLEENEEIASIVSEEEILSTAN